MSDKPIPTKPRACDHCRARKIRCDRIETQESACTPCIQSQTACTFVQKSTARSPPKWYELLFLPSIPYSIALPGILQVSKLKSNGSRLYLPRFAHLFPNSLMSSETCPKLHPGLCFPEIESQIEVGCWTTSDRPWLGVSGNSKCCLRAIRPHLPRNTAGNSPDPTLDVSAQEEQTMKQLLLTPYYGVADPYHVLRSSIRERFKKDTSEGGRWDLFQNLFDKRRPDVWVPLPVSSSFVACGWR